MLVALIVFLALVAATAFSVVRPGLLAVLVTLAVSIAWLPADSPVEGWVLLKLGDHHGVTIADLASVLAMLVALASWAAGASAAQTARLSETPERERTPS